MRRACAVLFVWAGLLGFVPAAFAMADAEVAARAGPSSREPAARPAMTLESLMARFASSGGVRARFHETRQLSILVTAIESEGELFFDPPDRLARYTTQPGRASVVVDGEQVVMRDETGEQRIELSTSEVARDLVGNLRVLLRGDLEALRSRFEVAFQSPGDERWSIRLTPRSSAMRGLVEWIRFEGRGGALQEMETRERTGDTTTTRLTDVATGLVFSAEEQRRIFSLDAAGRDD